MKTITEKGEYEVYWNDKGEIIIHFKPKYRLFQKIKKPSKYAKTLKLRKNEEVAYKVLRGNRLRLIKAKSNGKWRKVA